MPRDDVIVIGAGYAGLMASYRAVTAGRKVRLLAKGAGSVTLASGCIDVLGYEPGGTGEPVRELQPALTRLVKNYPDHPYAVAGLDNLHSGFEVMRSITQALGLDYEGNLDRNWLLPSTVGGVRPTSLVPASFVAGDLSNPAPMLIVGFRSLRDFYPEYVAANLTSGSSGWSGVEARGLTIDLQQKIFNQNVTPVEMARLFDSSNFRAEVVRQVKAHLGNARRVGFPAVLGLSDVRMAVADLTNRLGVPVFEIPTLPPSVPGLRLYHAFEHFLTSHGVRIQVGRPVLGGKIADAHVTGVELETAGHPHHYQAERYILATGGLLAGGLETHQDGRVTEAIFDLPVQAPVGRLNWFRPIYLDPQGQPLQRAGVRVDAAMRPVDEGGKPLADNLRVAGATVAGFDWPQERSGDGVAVATGYVAAGMESV